MAQKSGPHAFIKLFNEQNEPVSNALLFIKKDPHERGILLKTTFDEASGTYLVTEPVHGEYILEIAHAIYQEKKVAVIFTGSGKQEIFCTLFSMDDHYFIIGNRQIAYVPPHEERMVIAFKPGLTSEMNAQLQALTGKLGLEEITEPVIEGISQYKVTSSYCERKTTTALRKEESIKFFSSVLAARDTQLILLTGEITVRFRKGITEKAISEFIQKHNLFASRSLKSHNLYQLKSDSRSARELLELSKDIMFDPEVQEIDSNVMNTLVMNGITPNDYLFPLQWDHALINTPDAWENLKNDPQRSTKGNTEFGNPHVVIAICDGGIDISHPDLGLNLSDGSPKIKATFDFGTGLPDMNATSDSHGTGCAAAAAATTGTSEGIAGVAGNSGIMAIGKSGNPVVDADMYEWTSGLDPKNNSLPPAPSPGADIISDSTSAGEGLPLAVSEAFTRITTYGRNGKGTLVFLSAGNSKQHFKKRNGYGMHPNVMVVAASTLDENGNEVRADYSNFGTEIDFCAPSSTHEKNVDHNPPASRGTFTAAYGLQAARPVFKTKIRPGAAPVNAPAFSFPVESTDLLGAGGEVIIGQIGHADTERFTVIDANHSERYITLDHAPRVALQVGADVLAVFGNCPNNSVDTDTLRTTTQPGNQVIVNNPSLYRAGRAIIIGYGSPHQEAHVIKAVEPGSDVVTLMTNLKMSGGLFPGGTTVDIGTANYMNNFGGTSYATPVCAGIAALCLAANKNLSWVEVREILRTTAVKINPLETGIKVNEVRIGQWRNNNGWDVADENGAFLSGHPLHHGKLSAISADLEVIETNGSGYFEKGMLIGVQDTQGMEVRIVEDINAWIITLDKPLSRPFPIGAEVLSGEVPYQSAFYGFGRVDAAKAVAAALHSVSNYRQLVLRNNLTDPGTVATSNIQSPDIWVTNTMLKREITADKITTINAFGSIPTTSVSPGSNTPNLKLRIEIDKADDNGDTMAVSVNNGPVNKQVIQSSGNMVGNAHVQFLGTTGNIPGDYWDVHLDPVELPILYSSDKQHESPAITSDRYIYARMKNIITGEQSIAFKNLDARVRFYIALSNGKTANANNHGGTGFDSNFYFSDNDKNNDWNDTNPLSNIISGNEGTYFAGEVEIPKGIISPAVEQDMNSGLHTVCIAWPAAHIPPAGLQHSIYLLAHIAPFHGPMNGNGAHNNSALTYREISFTTFSAVDNFHQPLVKQMTVDPFGSKIEPQFFIDVQTEIGHFITEKASVEVVRINDNGTEEKVVYAHDGTNWRFDTNSPTIDWIDVNSPVVINDGTPATGSQQKIRFACSFQAGKEQKQVIIRPQLISKHTTAVIAGAEHVIDIVEDTSMPAGIDANTLASPPPPRSYAFADMANLVQDASTCFGPVVSKETTEFRVTSLFTATSDTNAYAIADGIVLLQPGATNETVNLVLRPFKQTMIGFTPVKYFIYRGLRKMDFMDSTSVLQVALEGPDNSEFIKRQHEIHKNQNAPNSVFLLKALGYDPIVQADSSNLDSYFFKHNPAFQLPMAHRGIQLGRFHHNNAHAFGLDIILEEGTYEINLAFVRKAAHIINVGGMPSGTDAQKFNLRIAREEILNFLDPAAFYGLHARDGGIVYTYNTQTSDVEQRKLHDIYTHILSPFHSKNRIYIDIRNDNGDSYNFFSEYTGPAGAPDHGKNIKIGTQYISDTVNNLVAQEYGHQGWPLVIEDRVQNHASTMNQLHLALRTDHNEKPLIYIQQISAGNRISPFAPGRFVDSGQLGVTEDSVWTSKVSFSVFNTGAAGAKLNIASIYKLAYCRNLYPAPMVWPDKVLKTVKHTDNLFGPINFNLLWQHDNIKWITSQDKRFVNMPTFGYMAERGVAVEALSETDPSAGRVVFFAVANDFFNPPDGFTNIQGITGGVSTKATFFEASFLRNLRINYDQLMIGNSTINTLSLTPANIEALAPNSVMLLCISREEMESLKAITGLHPKYPAYVTLSRLKTDQGSDTWKDKNGKTYSSFLLEVNGLDENGNYSVKMGNLVQVFSIDDCTFFSKAYSNQIPFPTIYERNAEENLGIQQKSYNSSITTTWEDFFIELDNANLNNGLKTSEIVDQFVTAIGALANSESTWSDLKQLIESKATALFERMTDYAKRIEPDDRVLYWARIKMKVALQGHQFMLQNFLVRNELLEQFEKITRGYTVSFTNSSPSLKKVLVIGFDPSLLDPLGGAAHNPLNSNPSGAIALALNNFIDFLPAKQVTVCYQSMILPVRYADYDYDNGHGIVEKYISKYIDPTLPGYVHIDHIIVLDKFLPHAFIFGRFAARTRGGGKDNASRVSPDFPSGFTGNPYYESSVPVDQVIVEFNLPTNNYQYYYNQSYEYKINKEKSVKKYDVLKLESPQPILDNPDGDDPGNLLPVNQPPTAITPVKGSFTGIANEVFYRLCALRDKKKSNVKIGLLMVPKLQGSDAERAKDPTLDPAFNPVATKDLVATILGHIADMVRTVEQ